MYIVCVCTYMCRCMCIVFLCDSGSQSENEGMCEVWEGKTPLEEGCW